MFLRNRRIWFWSFMSRGIKQVNNTNIHLDHNAMHFSYNVRLYIGCQSPVLFKNWFHLTSEGGYGDTASSYYTSMVCTHRERQRVRATNYPFVKRPLHVQEICANRVFAQIFWQCWVLFARLRKLLAWNQNNLIFSAQAANACTVWVLAFTNKPQYYSELTPCGCASCRYL